MYPLVLEVDWLRLRGEPFEAIQEIISKHHSGRINKVIYLGESCEAVNQKINIQVFNRSQRGKSQCLIYLIYCKEITVVHIPKIEKKCQCVCKSSKIVIFKSLLPNYAGNDVVTTMAHELEKRSGLCRQIVGGDSEWVFLHITIE